MVLQLLISTSLRLKVIPKGDKFIQHEKLQNKMVMIIKGNALVRIPWDNFKLKMTLNEYMINLSSMDQ